MRAPLACPILVRVLVRVFVRVGLGRLADPGAVIVGLAAAPQALDVARTIAADDAGELVPVDGAEVVVTAFGVPAQFLVGQAQAEHLGLRDGHVDKTLAQLIVAEPLDAPGGRLGRVGRRLVGRAEHHQRRPPVPVHRVLRHGLLAGRSVREGVKDLEPLTLVERLLLADADHGPGVRAVGAAAQRDLVHDGRTVHEPADRPDVGPVKGRVVEDAGVLLLPGVEQVEEFLAIDAERLGGGVEVQSMARLVLDLGDQDRFAAQAGRPGDPVALGLHADDLGVGVLGDLPDERLAVRVRHPVAGLDALVGGDELVEALLGVLICCVARAARGAGVVVAVHGASRLSSRQATLYRTFGQ